MEDLQPSLPSRPTILALPHELLLDILALVSPQDVSSFSQTCRDANSLINGEGSAPSHLWRRLFLEGWDALPDEEAGHMRSTLQSLTRARTDLRLGARSHPHLAKSHSRALHSLINATHSRLPRGPADDRNEDAPRSRSAATLASMFPPSYVGDRRWAAFVYPRQDVKRLSVWNEETKQERAKRLKASEEKAKKREADMEKKRARSSSGNRGAKSMAPTEAKKRRHNDEEGATSSSRRRSARIQRRTELAASDVFLPPSFLSFLPTERQADRDEQSMMASTRLEGLAECLDEEAAAHLHVLHGVRQMRFPTEEEKDRLLKKAKKKRQVEEAKKQKEVKAAARRLAAKRSAKGKGKRREDKNDSQQDIQPKSTPSRGSRSKVKPSMRRSTAGSEDDSDSLLFSGYESADGDEYAQYPSVMSAQHAPAMPLPAVSVPHFGELPRLYTSSGEGVHAQPRLHDGLNSDDDDLSRRKAGPSRKRDSASRTPSPSPSLDSEGQMDEYFDFREMVEDAYAEGFFASIEHRDAVLKGEADPPPHIDEAMFRLHSRRLAEAAGDNVDSEEEDDDYSAPESASDAYDGAEYDSEYLSADEDDDGDEELTPGLDFETADSIEESNVFLGHPQGPGGDATLRREARGVVYDAGRYGYENAWGPFKPFRTQPAEMRNGRRGPFAGLNLMQLGLGAGAHDEDDDSSDGDIEEVVDMETLDAQAAADGVTWQPGQDEEDDLAATTQAPALTNGTAAIAGSPLATTDEDDEDFSGSEDEEDDSDAAFSDDGLLPPFGGLGPHNFARMVAHVGAYSGSKVRNRLQDEREKLKAQQLQHPALPARTRVDWVLAESIMLVVHANLHYAIHRCGWGSGFMLPRGARGDGGGTSDGTNGRALVMPEIRGPLDACCHKRNRRLLYPHAGWGMSRGEEQPKDKVNGMTEEDSGEQEEGEEKQAARNDTPAVHDWANVESATWMGTYFFLDYPNFLRYNARLAEEVGKAKEPWAISSRPYGTDPNAPPYTGTSGPVAHELLHRAEATGDCLALRLTLKPADLQTPESEEGIADSASYGEEDPQFPTLRFIGRTYTHPDLDAAAAMRAQAADNGDESDPDDWDTDDPSPPVPTARGMAHGFVRPIYSEDPAQQRARYHAPTGRYLPLIVALQWRLTHAYDGADRWSLSGVQAGPPGTRAPIYGTWSDVERDDGSPLGPFAYFNVDSRPWREVERLRDEEHARREKVREGRRKRRLERETQLAMEGATGA